MIPVAPDPALVHRWRDAEHRFFGQAFVEPGLYEAAVELVRWLADGLRDLDSETALVAAYAERDVAWAERRAAALPGGRGRWLDVAAARNVTFHLRLREIAGQATSQATTTLVREARARGETWVTTVEGETTFAGQRTYRRVDLHTRAGIALYGYTHVDWERGEQCWLEVLRVDPETGAPVPGSRPVIQRRYRDRAALARAFARARRRYAGG